MVKYRLNDAPLILDEIVYIPFHLVNVIVRKGVASIDAFSFYKIEYFLTKMQ